MPKKKIKKSKIDQLREEIPSLNIPKNLKLLSIDQALNYTAFSVFYNKKLIFYSLLDTSNRKICRAEKILCIRNEVFNLIRFNDINYVVYEDIYYCSLNAYKPLAMLFGVIEVLLYELNIPSIQIHPLSWKSHINGIRGSRDDQKIISTEYADKRWNLDIAKYTEENYPSVYKKKKGIDLDIADSICIGTLLIDLIEDAEDAEKD